MTKHSDPGNQWYGLARWKKRRRAQLRQHPLCCLCLHQHGLIVPATIADHVEPHHGDRRKFETGALQSLCTKCHDAVKRTIENRGYSTAIGVDGWPLDRRHPCYGRDFAEPGLTADLDLDDDDDEDEDEDRPRQRRRSGYSVPQGIGRSAIPVTLVCGPPAAGKTTWVRERAQSGDTVIDLDACKVLVGGRRWDQDPTVRSRALRYRDQMLAALAAKKTGRAYVIVGAPTMEERREWCRFLGVGSVDVVILNVPAETCIDRLRADPERSHAECELIAAVSRWHDAYRLG